MDSVRSSVRNYMINCLNVL